MLTLLIANRYGYHSVPYPIVDHRPHVQAEYEARRRRGESHRLAAMLACRQAPMMKGSDRAFWEGRSNENQFASNPRLGNYYREVARRHGVSTKGRVYCSQLADFPGDPKAWVSGVDDIKKIAVEKDMTVTGIVNYKAPPREVNDDHVQQQFSDRYRVADDIVEDVVFDRCVENPELVDDLKAHPQKLADMKQEISDHHSGRV